MPLNIEYSMLPILKLLNFLNTIKNREIMIKDFQQ